MPTSLSLMKHFWSRSSRLFSCADFLLISFILVEHFARNSEVKFNRQFRGYLTMHGDDVLVGGDFKLVEPPADKFT